MTQRLRIFISSPGDVPDERLRADLIIDKLAQDYSRYFSVESYRWEHEPMLASGHFQDAIEPPSAADVVVLILWSRLGTPLPEKTGMREYRGLDGRVPVTGTEWEYEEALAAARQRGAPDILVFRNVSPASIDARDPEARAKSLQQLDALDAFWKRYFADRGVFLAGASEYHDLEDFARRLEESLRKLIERRIKSRAGASSADAGPTWLGNPFRGLQSYEFEHAAIFFGRDALVAKAAEHLSTRARAGTAFLLVVGASGSGKSSLVKAALVPRLMKPQRIEGTAMLRRVVFRPGEAQPDLFLGFAEALTRQPDVEGLRVPELLASGQTAKELADYLRASLAAPGFIFTNALGRVTEAARASKRILPHETAKVIVVIDQFEELFTSPQISPDDCRSFVQLLKGLASSGVVWIVGTMRADFWHHVVEVPDLLALSEGTGHLDIPAPSPAEIAEMIRKPARAAGLSFETNAETGLGLDTVLAEHASSEPGVLPLLSFSLDALYREDVERRGGHQLTFAEYEALGGLEGAIAKRADEVLESLPPQVRETAPRVLRALATLGGIGNGAPVARSVPLNSFPPGSDPRAVVDAFVSARLLVASTEEETATVRIAHESLINRWERARQQLTADRRDLETRAFIEQQYARWQQSAKSTREQLLLRDPDLANALDLDRRWGDEIGANVREFIALSHRRQRRRHQFAVAASIVFGIVALAATVFGVIAYAAQQQAENARGRAVTAEAMAVTERDHAVQQRNAALVSQSRYLATEADALVKEGQIRNAIALVRAALPDPDRGNSRSSPMRSVQLTARSTPTAKGIGFRCPSRLRPSA
jgi:Novel STAND NTPase 1